MVSLVFGGEASFLNPPVLNAPAHCVMITLRMMMSRSDAARRSTQGQEERMSPCGALAELLKTRSNIPKKQQQWPEAQASFLSH